MSMFLNFLKGIFNFLIEDIKSIFYSHTNSLKYWKIFLYSTFFLFIFMIIFESLTYCYYKSHPIRLQKKPNQKEYNLPSDLSL